MIDEVADFSPDNYTGKNNRYGVREHAMTSILNGILLHGDAKSLVSIFFVFSDCSLMNTNSLVLPKGVKNRVAIEMRASFGWHHYVGSEGKIIGIDHFSENGKGEEVIEHLGFIVKNVVKEYLTLV